MTGSLASLNLAVARYNEGMGADLCHSVILWRKDEKAKFFVISPLSRKDNKLKSSWQKDNTMILGIY